MKYEREKLWMKIFDEKFSFCGGRIILNPLWSGRPAREEPPNVISTESFILGWPPAKVKSVSWSRVEFVALAFGPFNCCCRGILRFISYTSRDRSQAQA